MVALHRTTRPGHQGILSQVGGTPNPSARVCKEADVSLTAPCSNAREYRISASRGSVHIHEPSPSSDISNPTVGQLLDRDARVEMIPEEVCPLVVLKVDPNGWINIVRRLHPWMLLGGQLVTNRLLSR